MDITVISVAVIFDKLLIQDEMTLNSISLGRNYVLPVNSIILPIDNCDKLQHL